MIFFFLLNLALAQTNEQIQAGRYLVHAAGCRDCHTQKGGRDFAGGLQLPTPFGTFITPNITPDPETGIGKWTQSDFQKALRHGVSPDGKVFYPAFPYTSFTYITDSDAENIYHYLRTVPSVHQINPHNRLNFPFDQRWTLEGWQWINFSEGPYKDDPAQTSEWNRGAYLVKAVLHCAECHTPRNVMGGLENSKWLAGSNLVFSGKTPPNLTPDPTTGLQWNKDQWVNFLSSGFTPNHREMAAEMALVIRETTGLTDEDRAAMATYMITVPPVKRFSGDE